MKKVFFSILILFISLTINPGYSYRIDENELRNTEPIEFVNYTGIWRKRETVNEVMVIGQKLAYAVDDPNAWANFALKYRIIHAVDEAEPDKFAADIFSIERDAQVNHIYSLRLIISAYLQTEYGYSASDAMLLAKFVTYYNAAHWGDVAYFNKFYKAVVTKHLTAENAGMSRIYSDWPGKTRIVIPLSRGAGYDNLTSVDTRTIADNTVIDELRQQTNRSVDERQQMTDLQQQEVDNLRQQNQDRQNQLEDQQNQQRQQEQDVRQTQEQLRNTTDTNRQQQLQEQLQNQTNQLQQTQDQIDQTQNQIEQTDADIRDRQQQIDEQNQQIQQDRRDNEIAQNPDEAVREVRQREDEVTQREQEVAQREQEQNQRENQLRDEQLTQNVFNGRFYYMKIIKYLDQGYYNNEMYLIDPATAKVIVKSPYQTISGDHYDVFSKGVVVIGFLGSNYQNHKLVLLDGETLKPVAFSADFIFWRSFVEVYDGYIYAIVMQDGGFYLGKFDENLFKVAMSDVRIAQDTFISFYGDFVYVNGLNNSIVVLNRSDLKMTNTINP